MDYIYQVEIYHQQRLLGRFITGNNFPEKDLSEFIQLIKDKGQQFKVYKATNEKRILLVENGITKIFSTNYDLEPYTFIEGL
ncbi:hypothetical protein [Acinetobacter sp. P8-3-8]|uniref:hypothetical protein n=1 Tax=Acinetobacter sp. P8-3-8 TaxID=1029823 RepID=UPI0002485984|nr:hypothetical protein [Acinetobacter sp. P8-3-8]